MPVHQCTALFVGVIGQYSLPASIPDFASHFGCKALENGGYLLSIARNQHFLLGAQKLIDARHAAVPMGHMGDAWDVAHAVLFLASDEARFITATEIVVDGGSTATMP